MFQRGESIGVGQVYIRSCFYQQPDHLSVSVVPIPQDDGFEQRRPSQPVYVINWDVRF